MTRSIRHLLGIEDLSVEDIRLFLDAGKRFKKELEGAKKFDLLRGKTVVSLFYEASTRTRGSFEMAAKRLGADFIHMNADASSSVIKGETLVDTAKNLEAMNPDFLVLRHSSSGAAQLLVKHLKIPVINAGDGFHEHPTQALLDAVTIEESFGSLKGLNVTIVGDIAHSRVARSNIHLLGKMGAKVTACGPPTLIPPHMEKLRVKVSYRIREAIQGADVVMMLRIQSERQNDKQIPSNNEYFRFFGLHQDSIRGLKKGAIIMHPGPINRGVEISAEVADGKHSVILNQVTNGVAVRMGVLSILMGGQ
jgi:aspartate carbamoyltransferase catalytic subunit